MTQEKAQAEDPGAGLFFQLASEDRKQILSELLGQRLHLNETAKRLGMTATETLRQLQRLSEASLVQKRADGTYDVTGYGKLVLQLSSSLEFVARQREYFLAHDGFQLPVEFRARLGELSGSELVPTTIESINAVSRLFSDAQKRIDVVVLGTESLIKILEQRIQEDVEIRWLMHEKFKVRAREILRTWKRLPEIRWTPTVPGHVVVTDRGALLTIRGLSGEMTYQSFVGSDASFMKWARDLFEYEFDRARPWSP